MVGITQKEIELFWRHLSYNEQQEKNRKSREQIVYVAERNQRYLESKAKLEEYYKTKGSTTPNEEFK